MVNAVFSAVWIQIELALIIAIGNKLLPKNIFDIYIINTTDTM